MLQLHTDYFASLVMSALKLLSDIHADTQGFAQEPGVDSFKDVLGEVDLPLAESPSQQELLRIMLYKYVSCNKEYILSHNNKLIEFY
jgi:hypothetical protein